MSRKKKISLVVSLVLIAAIGIGATLAYLTANTGTLTNKFTVGPTEIEAEILETDLDGEGFTDIGNDYELLPGEDAVKDPFVRITSDFSTYVFVRVTGLDALTGKITADIPANGWVRVGGAAGETIDGVYRAPEVLPAGENVDTPRLFTTVTLATSAVGTTTLEDIVLTGYAIQAEHLAETPDASIAVADAQALAKFGIAP